MASNQNPQMMLALSTADLISTLSRSSWDAARREAFALVLLDAEVPIARLAETARWLLGQVDPDDITPARLIEAAKRYTPPAFALLTSEQIASDIRPGYGQPTSTKAHSGNVPGKPHYELPNRAERRRLNAFYLRRATETAAAIAKSKRAENARRGDLERIRDVVRAQIAGLMRRWLREGRRYCDWCRDALSEANLAQYAEWARDLGQIRPIGTPMPDARVFCNDCAPGAITELIDGVGFEPVPF